MTNTFTLPVNQLSALVTISDEFSLVDEKVILNRIVKSLKLTVVKEITHIFPTQGKTIAYILSQSHLIVHTWPEHGYFHIDLVTCTHIEKKQFKDAVGTAFSNLKINSIQIHAIELYK